MKTYPIDEKRQKDLDNSFTYHSPQPDQIPRYGELRDAGKTLAVLILTLVPPSREQSVAITRLEEVIMWANKGIACGESQ